MIAKQRKKTGGQGKRSKSSFTYCRHPQKFTRASVLVLLTWGTCTVIPLSAPKLTALKRPYWKTSAKKHLKIRDLSHEDVIRAKQVLREKTHHFILFTALQLIIANKPQTQHLSRNGTKTPKKKHIIKGVITASHLIYRQLLFLYLLQSDDTKFDRMTTYETLSTTHKVFYCRLHSWILWIECLPL